jgi:uncharacterized lipoprotein
MKKLVLLACTLLLTGCSVKQPATTDLNLLIMGQSNMIYSGEAATIRGEDTRMDSAVAVYRIKEDPAIKVTNISAPHVMLTEQLANGYREQGLIFSNGSDVRILFKLNELLVTITKPKMLYLAEAKSQISIQVVKGSKSVTKKYDRQATQESAKKPDIFKIETMLNSQLSDIINQILKDEDLRAAISAR